MRFYNTKSVSQVNKSRVHLNFIYKHAFVLLLNMLKIHVQQTKTLKGWLGFGIYVIYNSFLEKKNIFQRGLHIKNDERDNILNTNYKLDKTNKIQNSLSWQTHKIRSHLK